ncbi:ABC transporter permease [Actinoplanes cyaneus]|uniref:ABC transporter permease n=1 Tax=Actinoplanes cyaneus TaxID=52696 RepID=A0A919MBW8_9ACTN|nr:FtsX family ABC transporter permease [Actinoplanes cyaneus]MCW2140211.1 putative ABC transport system permease protein [Actinoplanes cyaneus]GID65526.1 ABC transporter permease [Actinoplanes cyaneus]
MLRLRRMAGALVAVVIGIALVTLALLLLVAGRPKIPDRLAHAAVIVQAPTSVTPADPFPPVVPWPSERAVGMSERLAGLSGVAAAVADRSFYTQVIVDGTPSEATLEDHGWSSARLGDVRLVTGEPPSRPGEVVLDRALGFSPGGRVTLLTAGGPMPYTVVGLIDAPQVLLSDEEAARLSPGVAAIGLVLAPGADTETVAGAAREIAGGAGSVLTGDERGVLEPREDARTRWIGMQVLTGVAALAGFVTVFVVASTFAFTVTQRRRELGLLRAVGATPRQVRRMVYGEALLVGGAGAVLGAILGAALASVMGGVLMDAGFEPATYEVRISALPILGALLLGPLVALAGAWAAARRAARVRPLEALREAAVEQRSMGRLRWITGGSLVAAGVALAVGTATSDDAQDGATYALLAAMALVTGMVALAPAAIPLLVRLWRLPLRRGGGAIGLLVREGALSAARRTASTAAPVLLTVAFAVLVAGMVRTSTAAYAAGRAADVAAGRVMVPDRAPGLSDAAVAAATGAAVLPATVFGADSRALIGLAIDPVAFARADRGTRVVTGALDGLRDADTVVVTESAHLAPGALTPVVFADGQRVALRVVAVVADRSIRGDLLLSRETLRRHDASALTSAVYLDRDVPAGVGARVIDTATWAAEADSAEDRLVWLFTLMLIAVSAGYGAIAVANTLLMAAGGRARDLRVVRLAGATRRQVAGYVAAESTLIVLIGAVLGGVVAFGALLGVRAGLSQQMDTAVPLVVPWPVVTGVVGLCLLLALAAGVLPTRRMLGAPALRVREGDL